MTQTQLRTATAWARESRVADWVRGQNEARGFPVRTEKVIDRFNSLAAEARDGEEAALPQIPVSYTHLTLPTNREV